MSKAEYEVFEALNPFFEVVMEGLRGLVDGDHYFDTIAEDAFFEFRYHFPGWPLTIRGRGNLMDQFSGYGNNIKLHSADGLVVHRSQDSRVVILEYDVHGKILSTGVPYDNSGFMRGRLWLELCCRSTPSTRQESPCNLSSARFFCSRFVMTEMSPLFTGCNIL